MGQSIIAIMPEVLMTFFAIGLLVIDLIASDEKKSGIAYFGIAFILITLLLT
ncbi:MAG: NADH-quinone oxidoreductase subunit N, partial [Flexistipes sinusarabici]